MSRVRLVIAADEPIEAIVTRGQAMLSRGAPTIELAIVGPLGEQRRAALEVPLRRLAGAAKALGATLVACDEETARALRDMGV